MSAIYGAHALHRRVEQGAEHVRPHDLELAPQLAFRPPLRLSNGRELRKMARSPTAGSLSREERQLMIAANNGYVLAFDNLSGLPNWLSDSRGELFADAGFFNLSEIPKGVTASPLATSSPGTAYARRHVRPRWQRAASNIDVP